MIVEDIEGIMRVLIDAEIVLTDEGADHGYVDVDVVAFCALDRRLEELWRMVSCGLAVRGVGKEGMQTYEAVGGVVPLDRTRHDCGW